MKRLILTLFIASLSSFAFAQWGEEEMSEKPTLRDRIFVGGGFGLSFSSYYDYFSISPIIGYKITPKFVGGIGLQYSHYKYKGYSPAIQTNNYGGSVFLRYNFYGPLFVHTEYEYLDYQFTETQRQGFSSFMAGGGFFQPIGRRAGIFVMALYNFSYQNPTPGQYSVYNSPLVIRAGITAGF
ncbi:MAG TPA: hypothetical protein PLJ60_11015 [Chryseolinea sp.]|nr:hypothetical protein [Chryseolinea sp.]HPH47469.1 hypothetical protein [Chryseolinea sp.]HPM30852.1 hypothetical protein [Chryseolinea sp.]